MKTTERGFTLIESLLVLSIFLIISSVTVFTIKPQYEWKESEMFLTQLKADLLYGQQYAISHQQEVTVIFSEQQHSYYLRTSSSLPPFVVRNYSENITVSPGSLPLSFKFSPSGTINKFGSFFIQCGSKHYRFTFLIGKGRFYAIEE
jgi:competence protein ComGD